MPDMWDAAQASAAVKYDPQQAALQRQLDLSQKNTASNEQAIQGYGNTGRNAISSTYNTLYGLLGANKTDTQNSLNQQLDLTNRGYDQAIQNIQGWQQGSRDYISQMAAALGQSGQGLVSSGQLENSVNQQLGYANAAKTNYGSTLGDWIAKMGSLSDMGINSAHSRQAMDTSGFETELLNMLGQNKLAGTNQETDVINKIADLMNVRQSDLVDMYNQLTAQQWDRDFKQASLNEQASEASADLSYKYASLNQQAAESAANRAASGQLSLKDLWGMMSGAQSREDDLNQNAITNAQKWAGLEDKPSLLSPDNVISMMNNGMYGGDYDPTTATWNITPEARSAAFSSIGQPVSTLQNLIARNNAAPTAQPAAQPGGGQNNAGDVARNAIDWTGSRARGGSSLNFLNGIQRMAHGFSLGNYRG